MYINTCTHTHGVRYPAQKVSQPVDSPAYDHLPWWKLPASHNEAVEEKATSQMTSTLPSLLHPAPLIYHPRPGAGAAQSRGEKGASLLGAVPGVSVPAWWWRGSGDAWERGGSAQRHRDTSTDPSGTSALQAGGAETPGILPGYRAPERVRLFCKKTRVYCCWTPILFIATRSPLASTLPLEPCL